MEVDIRYFLCMEIIEFIRNEYCKTLTQMKRTTRVRVRPNEDMRCDKVVFLSAQAHRNFNKPLC